MFANFGIGALELAVSLRIDQTIDPLRRGDGETHRHQFPRRCGKAVFRRRAMHVRAVGIGDDQAGVGGKYLATQILGEGEEQPVAMGPVFRPFLIGAQILHR